MFLTSKGDQFFANDGDRWILAGEIDARHYVDWISTKDFGRDSIGG